MQKMRATLVIYHILGSHNLEPFQGVLLDSLGVGAIKSRCKYAPNCCRHCQEVPKHFLVMLVVFLCFSSALAAWGACGLPLFVPPTALVLGGLKGQETLGWCLTTHMFWHFLCLWCDSSNFHMCEVGMGVVAKHVINLMYPTQLLNKKWDILQGTWYIPMT